MPTPVTYENTTPPPVMAGIAAGNLGKRSDSSLELAFDTPSGPDGAARNTEGGQAGLLRIAREKMETYNGENPLFPQYRRNFVPAGGTLTEEYERVRDKSTVTTGTGTGLGTAYSPTIASPGARDGINPGTLASVASTVNGVYDPSSPVALLLDNPSNEVHQNVGDAITGRTGENVGATGRVRTFRLGVGSGGTGALNNSIATSVAQFPRPLT